jgi:hypothetical protein
MTGRLALRGLRVVVLVHAALVLALHVPLGVAIFGLTVALALGAWRLGRPVREGTVGGAEA